MSDLFCSGRACYDIPTFDYVYQVWPLSPMIEIYRDQDFSKVGLYQGILESAGIETVLRNRNAVSMTTSVPIPSMYPNICVHTSEDATRARELLAAYADSASSEVAADWECVVCGEGNEGNFSECWSCQTDRSDCGVKDNA